MILFLTSSLYSQLQWYQNYGFNLNNSQIELFERYYDDLIETNKIHNLTTITEENDVIFKHFLDSILPVKLFKDNLKIIDIGCGAGFPSIPLKIINNTLNITAIDSVNKKIDFVSTEIKKLGISSGFDAIHTRIEDLAKNSAYREQFDYVISRALAKIRTNIEYSAPFLKQNGLIICYKGNNYLEELSESENALKELNCKVIDIKEYYISEIDAKRYIIIIKKIGKTPNKYPRSGNKPRLSTLWNF